MKQVLRVTMALKTFYSFDFSVNYIFVLIIHKIERKKEKKKESSVNFHHETMKPIANAVLMLKRSFSCQNYYNISQTLLHRFSIGDTAGLGSISH
jgi:hypothetical protein